MPPKISNTKQSSKLPTPWIEKIFRQLQGRFGNSFTNKYATGQIIEEKQLDKDGKPIAPVAKDLGIENAKSVWASQLGHLSAAEIAKGLEANYTYPPSCDDFVKAALSLDYETLFNEAVKGHSAIRSKINYVKRNKDEKDEDFIWTSPLAYWAGIEFGVTDLLASNYQRSQTRWNHCVEKAISQNKKTAPVPPTPAEHVKDSPIAKEVVGKVLGRMGSSNGREHWLSVVESDDFDKTPAITKKFAIDTLKKLNVPLPEKLQKYVYEGLKL